MKKVHEIVKAINANRKKSGDLSTVKYEEVIEKIKALYPDIEIADSTPWMSVVEDDVAKEIALEFAPLQDEPDCDLKEHLFVKFPYSGIFVLPVNLDGTPGRWVDVKTSKVGTTDLADVSKFLNLQVNKLSDYANWLHKTYKAKEISYQEFKELGFRGVQGYRPTDNREPPMNTA